MDSYKIKLKNLFPNIDPDLYVNEYGIASLETFFKIYNIYNDYLTLDIIKSIRTNYIGLVDWTKILNECKLDEKSIRYILENKNKDIDNTYPLRDYISISQTLSPRLMEEYSFGEKRYLDIRFLLKYQLRVTEDEKLFKKLLQEINGNVTELKYNPIISCKIAKDYIKCFGIIDPNYKYIRIFHEKNLKSLEEWTGRYETIYEVIIHKNDFINNSKALNYIILREYKGGGKENLLKIKKSYYDNLEIN